MSKHIQYELKIANARPRCKFKIMYSDRDFLRGMFEELLSSCAVGKIDVNM